jgi:hypothetical protein
VATTVAPASHTFICYARRDEAFVLDLARALRDRAIPIWLDQWNIQPGTDWDRSIDTALNESAAVLIVLSPDAVTSDEVLGELRLALDRRKRIIPLVYRPCEMPRQLRRRQWIDSTGSPTVSAAVLDRLEQALRDPESVDQVAPGTDPDRGGRRTLLEDVSAEAADRLRAIGADALIPLRFEQRPDEIARPWDHEAIAPARQVSPLPATDVVPLFDAAGGKLLILGAPGSGKTTALLLLLRELVDRAATGDDLPVPVLLNLASWKANTSIGDWMIDELKAKHGVRVDLARQWRNDRSLAPLLDGLDEVEPEHQSACVQAINEFYTTHRPPHLVVCCRQAEYEQLTDKLQLRAAVCLLPLDAQDIRTSLEHAARTDLWEAVHANAELMEMARSPLLLSFMRALPDAPDGRGSPHPPSLSEERRRLFDAYLSWQASAESSPRAYSPAETLLWLRRMAAILKKQGRSEFLIEQMQPEWLESTTERWLYRAGVLLVAAAVVSIVFRASTALFGLVPRGRIGRALESNVPAVFAEGSAFSEPLLLVIAVAIAGVIASRRAIVPVETLTWSWRRAGINARRWSAAAALAGLNYGMALGVAGTVIWQISISDATSSLRSAGEFWGTLGSVLAAVLLVLVRSSRIVPFVRRAAMGEALACAVVYAVIVGTTLTWLAAPFQGLGVFTLLAFSPASSDRHRVRLLRALTTGGICGAAIGAFSSITMPSSIAFVPWLTLWAVGGLAIGFILGLAVTLVRFAAERRRVHEELAATEAVRNLWVTTMVTAIGIGTALGLAAAAAFRLGIDQPIRNLALFGWWLQLGFVRSLSLMVFAAAATALAGVVIAGILGALAGALAAATGADVERRLAPNQGIRQSAVNAPIFAALGALIVGVPYGLFNLSVGAIMVQTPPSAADWVRLGMGAGASFGLLAGLVPGAACIQHFVLRAVLWQAGTLPLRWQAFLDFATRRRLLQRVGGRYRFIHILLRDHLSEPSGAPAAA